MATTQKYINNTSGKTGVSFCKRLQKWRSDIYIDGVSIYLGTYKDKNKAIDSREEAERHYGFHENNGS